MCKLIEYLTGKRHELRVGLQIYIKSPLHKDSGFRAVDEVLAALRWIEAHSKFAVSHEMWCSIRDINRPLLHPWDKDMEKPEGDIHIAALVWPCLEPELAGATWGGDVTTWGIPVIAVPYSCRWGSWRPYQGFGTWFQQAFVHEFINAIRCYLKMHGLLLKTTYKADAEEFGGWIDCAHYKDYAQCYEHVLGLLDTEMYKSFEKLPGTA